MRSLRMLIVGLIVLIACAAADIKAQQRPPCSKECGMGAEVARGERDGDCFTNCFWVHCEVAACTFGWGDCNDNCWSYLSCRPLDT